MKYVPLLAILLLFVSCENRSENNQELTIKKLIGEWDFVVPPNEDKSEQKIFAQERLIFVNDTLLENSAGFYEKKSLVELKAVSKKYEVKGNYITLYNSVTEQEEILQIETLSDDTLKIVSADMQFTFVKVSRQPLPDFEYDEIVFNGYSCPGTICPMAISIHNNGNIFYQKIQLSKKEFYKSRAGKELLQSLRRKVERANIPALNTKYGTNQLAYNVVITFQKDGKILKTISDSGVSSTKELFWLYTFLLHVPEIIEMDKVDVKNHQLEFSKLDQNSLKRTEELMKGLGKRRSRQ